MNCCLVSLTDSTDLALVWEDVELWRCYVLFYIKVCEYTDEFKFVTFVKGIFSFRLNILYLWRMHTQILQITS